MTAFVQSAFVLYAQADAAPKLEGPAALFASPLVPMLIVGALFYLMVLRPERNKTTERATLVSNLKKNDRVVTIGGIHGTVVNAQKDSSELVIKVDEGTNTKLKISRSAISQVITDESASQLSS